MGMAKLHCYNSSEPAVHVVHCLGPKLQALKPPNLLPQAVSGLTKVYAALFTELATSDAASLPVVSAGDRQVVHLPPLSSGINAGEEFQDRVPVLTMEALHGAYAQLPNQQKVKLDGFEFVLCLYAGKSVVEQYKGWHVMSAGIQQGVNITRTRSKALDLEQAGAGPAPAAAAAAAAKKKGPSKGESGG